MKVLVTGASGFVGQPVVQSLLLNGHSVLAISRKMQEESKLHSMKWLHADITHPETYQREVLKFSPEAIIHLAWEGIPDFSYEASILNLKSSLDLLYFTGSIESCGKIIVSGSCMELKRLWGKCLETETAVPKDYFTWAKHSINQYLSIKCAKQNVKLNWFRIFYVYGPGQRKESLIPMLIKSIGAKETPQINTPLNKNDFIYVEDVARAFTQLALSESTVANITTVDGGNIAAALR